MDSEFIYDWYDTDKFTWGFSVFISHFQNEGQDLSEAALDLQ